MAFLVTKDNNPYQQKVERWGTVEAEGLDKPRKYCFSLSIKINIIN